MHPVNSLKPIMAAALVMTALPIQAQQPSADASLDTRRSYDIPSLQLGSSLARIARESGQPISIDADLVRHLQAPPVQGRYTPCLLYTSPSPRDRQKSRMPSSA